ncbi:amidohydrolase 3 [Artomyces pyxidatus]|uniref:Amidohydrolase 3 n=1 Tax=Artomyces pyxidatus TaxID=48021 RepID=A0ACB8T450_9AGAM|nr:amidohydrolase 3 [Artomyces pyxidatus]
MVVNRDKVLLLGTQEHIRAQWSIRHPNTPLKLFQTKPGSIIVPGLADAHAHILEWGYKEQLPLADCLSVDDVITKLKQYLHSHPDVLQDPTRWITGMGWDQTKWPTGQFPTADDFDREPLLRGRPIVLSRIDVHAYWVSHSVIEKFSPLPDTVEGGLIIRDSAGNPTGIFVDNAMELVHLPKRSEAEVSESFEITMRDALSVGLTSIHDAWSTPEDIAFYKRLGDDGKLPVRLYLMGATTSDEYWGTQIPRLINYGRDGRLTVRSVKLFTDGALGSWGAALLAPYTDKPETTGLMRSSVSALHDLVEKFYADGWQVNIHAIGDRANKVLLDIFEDILSRPGADVRKWRPRIEHAQIMQPSDLERIGRLGVIASVQPTHATSDMWYAETRLGSERIKGAYAYQSLLQSSPDKILPLGSDFPVEGINPLLGFYAAVSRLSVNGASPNGTAGWYPAEALTRKQALQGMTRDAAYAAFAEAERGILAPGMKADYVVLDRDIMAVPVGEILKTKVLATVIDGRVAYGAI